MKQFLISLFLVAITLPSFAQFEVGMKAGVHSYDLDNIAQLNITNEEFNIGLSPLEAEYGFQFGLYTRVNILGFFIEPAVLLNSTEFSYQLDNSELPLNVVNERFLNLDIPLLIGVRLLRFLRIQAGPVGHVTLNSTSDLFNISGYEQTFEGIEYGYQAGVGLDIWKFRFDVLYENDFQKFGNHITIGGEQFSFSDNAARLVFNLGLKF